MAEFGSLHYTGCRAGEGLLGITGLQFRAVSAGVKPEQMTQVERTCLYEPPEEWMRRRLPAALYPPSFAHSGRSGFATAVGTYLGTEGVGSREGNHHTHAIVTDSPATYGQVRPAQLWRAGLWVTRPGPDEYTGPLACRPVPGDPAPGPFDALQLRDWVSGQPDGGARLLTVHTAVTAALAGSRRVLFVSSAPEPVVAWLAVATLLMPRPDALRVGFKIYVTNPEHGSHEVVAVHPDWAGPVRADDPDPAFVVVDLESDHFPDLRPAAASTFWVTRFLDEQRDTFDVLDAVEFYGQLPEPLEHAPDPRKEVAAAVVMGEPLPDDLLDGVLAWLQRRWRQLSEGVFGDVVARILDAPMTDERLAALDILAVASVNSPAGAQLRWRVFAHTLSSTTGTRWLPPRSADEAARAVVQALESADGSTTARVLAVAARYGLDVPAHRIAGALRRLADWWARGADQAVDTTGWPGAAELVDLLRDALTHRIQGAPPETARAIGQLWWRTLLRTAHDPRNPLDAVLATAAAQSGDPNARERATTMVLDGLRLAPRPDAVAVAWRILYTDRRPEIADLGRLLALGEAVGGVDAATGHRIESVLAEQPYLNRAIVTVLDRLARSGHVPRDPKVVRWWADLGTVREIVEQISGWPRTRSAVAEAVWRTAAGRLSGLPLAAVESVGASLATALLIPHPSIAAEFVKHVETTRRRPIMAALSDTVAGAWTPRAVAFAHIVVRGQDPPYAPLRDRLVTRRTTMTAAEVGAVAHLLDDESLQSWQAMGKRSWLRLPGRRRP